MSPLKKGSLNPSIHIWRYIERLGQLCSVIRHFPSALGNDNWRIV